METKQKKGVKKFIKEHRGELLYASGAVIVSVAVGIGVYIMCKKIEVEGFRNGFSRACEVINKTFPDIHLDNRLIELGEASPIKVNK